MFQNLDSFFFPPVAGGFYWTGTHRGSSLMAESGGQVEDKNLMVTCGSTTNSGALLDENQVAW